MSQDSNSLEAGTYAASTGSETSADDLSECSDTTLMAGGSVLVATTTAGGRKRRKRTIIAADQLLRMEQLYRQEQWPGRERKESLARDIGMSSHFVNIWFQNKRSRMKKLAQEEEELALLQTSRSPGGAAEDADVIRPAPASVVPPGPHSTKPVPIAPRPPGVQTALASSGTNRYPTTASPLLMTGRMPAAADAVRTKRVLPVEQQGINFTADPSSCQRNHQAVKHGPSQQSSTVMQRTPFSQRSPPFVPAMTGAHRRASLPGQLPNGKQLTFFKCLVSMMAVEEGGLIRKGDPEFDVAVNSALYGLRMANDNIITYKKKEGLLIHTDQQ